MKNFKKTAIASLVALVVPIAANAGIVVHIDEVGSNIELSYGAGSLNTTGLSAGSHYSGCSSFFTGLATLVGGGAAGGCTQFSGGISVSQSTGWTQAGSVTNWSSILGAGGLIGASDYFGSGANIFVGDDPAGALVGLNSLSGFAGTVNGATFASVGLTGNEFITYSWAGDSLTFSTGGFQSVPEPTVLSLFGLALAGIGIARRKKV